MSGEDGYGVSACYCKHVQQQSHVPYLASSLALALSTGKTSSIRTVTFEDASERIARARVKKLESVREKIRYFTCLEY